ncbi:MAG: hypothetical protein EPO55_14205 [Reyranella sp.]|nr:MAG: hypothetical protein EPO55_14205 [Reyranella sp.]
MRWRWCCGNPAGPRPDGARPRARPSPRDRRPGAVRVAVAAPAASRALAASRGRRHQKRST